MTTDLTFMRYSEVRITSELSYKSEEAIGLSGGWVLSISQGPGWGVSGIFCVSGFSFNAFV